MHGLAISGQPEPDSWTSTCLIGTSTILQAMRRNFSDFKSSDGCFAVYDIERQPPFLHLTP